MTWAQRLKRVFAIEVETCGECGGTVKVIASIEDPAVITTILDHLGMNACKGGIAAMPRATARPIACLKRKKLFRN